MRASPGDAVRVPFGRKVALGVVMALSDASTYEGETRDVQLAGERLLLPHQVRLARWMAARYLAPLAECAALMLPPEADRRLLESVVWCGASPPPDLTPADARFYDRLRSS